MRIDDGHDRLGQAATAMSREETKPRTAVRVPGRGSTNISSGI